MRSRFFHRFFRYAAASAFALLFTVLLSLPADAQRRDYMTDAEIELVRDNQEMDLRMSVLVRMIDRRFAALGIDAGTSSEKTAKSEVWGDSPTGTRLELLTDIRKILLKAVDDLDLAAERDEDALNPESKSGKVFARGYRKLEDAAKRYGIALDRSLSTAANEAERGQMLNSIELCTEIVAAAAKLSSASGK